jgi:uncharacterized membrane protein YjgN (DUF898 family)
VALSFPIRKRWFWDGQRWILDQGDSGPHISVIVVLAALVMLPFLLLLGWYVGTQSEDATLPASKSTAP